MEVSMDGLRNRLISDYNSLVRKLNRSYNNQDWRPEIVLEPDNISRELDGIRSAIVTLAFSYIEGEDGFKCMDDDTHFEVFMPEEDEINL